MIQLNIKILFICGENFKINLYIDNAFLLLFITDKFSFNFFS